MKKTVFLTLCLVLAAVVAVRAEEVKPAADTPAAAAWKNKTFTAEELKKYNGQDGMPVYTAVDGIVYDLSKSKYWKNGRHMKMHDAGADLSAAIHTQAPKGIHKDGKILEKMPKVGVLRAEAPVTAAKPAAGTKTFGPVALHKITSEELDKEERCAITRKALKVTRSTPAVAYKGKIYYFSSMPLADKFLKEPEKYLNFGQDKIKSLFKKKA